MKTVTLNMKHILTGKIKHFPVALDQDEKIDFANSLSTALEMYFNEVDPNWLESITRKELRVTSIGFFKEQVEVEVVDAKLLPAALREASDNYIAFLLDNDFDKDIIIMAFVDAVRNRKLVFDSETKEFGRLFDRIGTMLAWAE